MQIGGWAQDQPDWKWGWDDLYWIWGPEERLVYFQQDLDGNEIIALQESSFILLHTFFACN